jgi:hypothetical protein
MAETGRLAPWLGIGTGFEIRESPVPDPKPGAALIAIALANVRGSGFGVTTDAAGRALREARNGRGAAREE